MFLLGYIIDYKVELDERAPWFYTLPESYFDRSWALPDIEKIKCISQKPRNANNAS